MALSWGGDEGGTCGKCGWGGGAAGGRRGDMQMRLWVRMKTVRKSGNFPVPFTGFFSPIFGFIGIYEKRYETGIMGSENGTINCEMSLPTVFGFFGKIQ